MRARPGGRGRAHAFEERLLPPPSSAAVRRAGAAAIRSLQRIARAPRVCATRRGDWHPTRQRPKWLCGGVGSLPMRRINEARALGQIDVEREMAEVREERAEYRRKAEEERRKQQEANLALREAQVET